MNLKFYENLCSANQEVIRECLKLKKYGQNNEYYIQNSFMKIVKKVGERKLKIYHPDILYDHFASLAKSQSVWI